MIAILGIYAIGVLLLIGSSLLGSFVFSKKEINHSEKLVIGFLLIISVYAIVKTGGITIANLILIWIGSYFVITGNNKLKYKLWNKKVFDLIVLWSLIFLLKVSYFWNREYDLPNLQFKDYPYYMKLSESFALYGKENALGHLNGLFEFQEFLQPYRSIDLWLPSLGLDLTSFDTVYIWELFYGPIGLTIIAYTIFDRILLSYNKITGIIFSILSLFLFSGGWFRGIINLIGPDSLSGSLDPMGMVAYPKLSFVYVIYLIVLWYFFNRKYINAIIWLCLMPLLVQTTISLIPITLIFIVLLYYFEKARINSNLIRCLRQMAVVCVCISVLFIAAYKASENIESGYFFYMNQDIINFLNVADLFVIFLKKAVLFFISYNWLFIFIFLVLLMLNKNLEQKYLLLVVVGVFYLISIGVFSFFNNVGDAYQLHTNIFAPLMLCLILYLFLYFKNSKTSWRGYPILFVALVFPSLLQIIGGSNAFHSTNRLQRYSKNFLIEAKDELSGLDYPYGLYYYGPEEDVPPKEHFPLTNAAFLKLFGRNYDVFSLGGLSLLEQEFTFEQQKYCVFIARHSMNILFNEIETQDLSTYQRDFTGMYPFEFCLSMQPYNKLPGWLKEKIDYSICDDQSQINYYRFKKTLASND